VKNRGPMILAGKGCSKPDFEICTLFLYCFTRHCRHRIFF